MRAGEKDLKIERPFSFILLYPFYRLTAGVVVQMVFGRKRAGRLLPRFIIAPHRSGSIIVNRLSMGLQ